MDRRNLFLYVLPALPILCLGIALLVFIFSPEYNTYSSTFPTSTLPASPTSTDVTTGTPPPIAAVQPTPVPTGSSSMSPDIEKERERFFNVVKDVALVVAASIITFSSSYVGGLIQSTLQKQQEKRSERRTQVKKYKDYLEWIFNTGQRKDLLDRIPALKRLLPNQGRAFDIDETTFQRAVTDMPPALGLQALDEDLQREFDDLVVEALDYLTKVAHGEKPNYKTINEKYNKVMKALDAYAAEDTP